MTRLSLLRFSVIAFLMGMPLHAGQKVTWNGYTQLRHQDDYHQESGFGVRRVKLWIDGPMPAQKNIIFKVMGIFRMNNRGAFELLDVFGEYRFALGSLRFGQMVPDFSLEWSQPDARLPLVERAAVVDAMIPGAETLGRKMGTMLLAQSPEKTWHASAGVFNGSGANQSGYSKRGYMLTARAFRVFDRTSSRWLHLGGLVLLRDQPNPIAKKIFGTMQKIDGPDFRSGLEGQLRNDRLGLQAEYLTADLDGERSNVYYALLHYQINQTVLSLELVHKKSFSSRSEAM